MKCWQLSIFLQCATKLESHCCGFPKQQLISNFHSSRTHTNITRNFVCDIVCGTKKKEKFYLEKYGVTSLESSIFHLLEVLSFFAVASENLFFGCESTNMRRLPHLIG